MIAGSVEAVDCLLGKWLLLHVAVALSSLHKLTRFFFVLTITFPCIRRVDSS